MLFRSIPTQDRNFSDVWDIVALTDGVLFRCSNKIFYYTKNQIRVFRPTSEWGFMGIANGKAYVQDYETGLWVFQTKNWTLLPTSTLISKNDPITSIIATGKDSVLISSLKNGIYEMVGQQIKKILTPNQGLFINDRIYAATLITQNRIALATNNNGVYIIDNTGNIIQRFSKKEGLQHNNVLSIFCDNEQNLWLGLDNGIDFIAFNSAIKQISPSQEDGAGYTMAIHKNQLYIGTSNGLFSAPLIDNLDKSYTLASFNKIPSTDGQVWSLSEYNNELLMGHHEGGFVIKNNNAIPFNKKSGNWNFVPLQTANNSDLIAIGQYQGVSIFEKKHSTLTLYKTIPSFEESSRYLVTDSKGNVWVSHPYHGIFKISVNDTSYPVKKYDQQQGIPAPLNNQVFLLNEKIILATEKGIYIYHEALRIELSPLRIDRLLNTSGSRSISFADTRQKGVFQIPSDS